MLRSTLHHVTTNNLSQLYRLDTSSHGATSSNQKYSALAFGTESARVGHFVEKYCSYFRDYYSLAAPRTSMHPRGIKLGIDHHIRDHVSNLDYSLREVIRRDAPSIETIAFWLEAGAVPSDSTLIEAIEKKLPLKTLQLLVEHGQCSSSVVMSAMNNKCDRPFLELLINRTLKDTGELSPGILITAINNHLTMIQYLLRTGVPPSQGAVCAAIREGLGLEVIEFLLNAYIEATSKPIDPILKDTVSSKTTPEILALLFKLGAKTSLEIVKTALSNKQPAAIIRLLLDDLVKNEKKPEPDDLLSQATRSNLLHDILNHAAQSGNNADILTFIMEFGARPSSETLDLTLYLTLPSWRDTPDKAAEQIAIGNIELLLKSVMPTETTLILALSRFHPSSETVKTTMLILDKIPNCTNNKSLDHALERKWPFDPVIKTLLGKGAVASLENLHTAILKGYSLDTIKALQVQPNEVILRSITSQKVPRVELARWALESGVELTYGIIKLSVSDRCETIEGKNPKAVFAKYLLDYNFERILASKSKNDRIDLYDEVLYPAIVNGYPGPVISLIICSMTDKNGPSLASVKAARDRAGDGIYGIVNQKSNEVYGGDHMRHFADSKGMAWWPKKSPYED